jgi:hypothetical protein
MHTTIGWNTTERSTFRVHYRPMRPWRSLRLTWIGPPSWIGLWCLLLWLAQALPIGTPHVSAAPPPASEAEDSTKSLVGGPFPIRSLSPIQLLYFQFTPERAVPVLRGGWNVRFDLLEANYLARDDHRGDSFLFDFELTRANLALQYGLLDRLAVGLEIPMLYTLKSWLASAGPFPACRSSGRLDSWRTSTIPIARLILRCL